VFHFQSPVSGIVGVRTLIALLSMTSKAKDGERFSRGECVAIAEDEAQEVA
jgi:hypothetical protein